MKKIFGFLTKLGEYSIGTQKDIDKICKESNTTVVNQELANYDDVEWSVCCGSALDEGMYIIKEGILFASDDGIEIISNLVLS
ncbi:hypothetical protein [Clostridium estertheticum]|uniref:hypothetical protein n=1 Tax=Clostridium estertheticum TaxID=238834 RepID=UPI001CF2D997|nr:hypothetical protein [Clostridium estertheticum]MCB2340876.1 hypothetical protein [Clostridium estertheticum]